MKAYENYSYSIFLVLRYLAFWNYYNFYFAFLQILFQIIGCSIHFDSVVGMMIISDAGYSHCCSLFCRRFGRMEVAIRVMSLRESLVWAARLVAPGGSARYSAVVIAVVSVTVHFIIFSSMYQTNYSNVIHAPEIILN